MKKIIYLISFSFLLTSCFWWPDQSKIEEAKNQLLDTGSITNNVSTWSEFLTWTIWEDVKNTEEFKNYSIQYTTGDKFIELDSLEWNDFDLSPIEITWKTLDKVDKIVVNFSNKDSTFPTDSYNLKQFKSWSETFKYNASPKNKVLDYGENVYEFEAYSQNKVSKLKLIINIKKDSEFQTSTWTISEINISDLPTWPDFWNPISIWTDKFWYSDLKWLELSKSTISNLSCDTLNDYLLQNIDTYYYWNTCRDIVKWKWITFYITKLNWKNYIYQKYYVTNNWLVWVYDLERWEWNDFTKDLIKDKNDELKLKNADFEVTKIIDSLFVKIVSK